MTGRRLAGALLAAALLVLVATYAGGLHPTGDSLAVGRPFLAALLVAAGLVLRGCVGWTAAAVGAVALAPLLWAMRPVVAPEAGQGIVVYQKNLLYSLEDPSAIADDIRKSGADLVLLQELSRANLPLTETLSATLPHQMVCRWNTPGTVAILSRWPLEEQDCALEAAMGSARVSAPQGPVTVVSLHLSWPWPRGQAGQVELLLPRLRALPRPMIVAGDFNAVPWSATVRSISAASGTRRAGPVRPSFFLGGLPLTIDHVLAPEDWSAATKMRPGLGSDHRGQVTLLSR